MAHVLKTTTLGVETALTVTLTEADMDHEVLGDQEEKPTKACEKKWPVLKERFRRPGVPQSHVK